LTGWIREIGHLFSKLVKNERLDKHIAHEVGLRSQAYRLVATQPIVPTKEADMELYAGIDLQSNYSVLNGLDSQDRTVFFKRLPNDLEVIVPALKSCAGTLRGVAVDSTYNQY
jgi:hypothetical protein